MTVALDKHRPSEAPPVPLPPPPTDARFGRLGPAPASASLSVEIPPPVGRG